MIRLILVALILIIAAIWSESESFSFSDYMIERPLVDKEALPRLTEKQTKNLKQALSQPFEYLNDRLDRTVYQSQDKQWKLKLFKTKAIEKRHWGYYLPLPSRVNPFLKKQEEGGRTKRDRLSLRYEEKLAQSPADEVYPHFDRTNDLKKRTVLHDKRGRKHLVDMDKTQFVLEKSPQDPGGLLTLSQSKR